MPETLPLAEDARAWLSNVFAECSRRTAVKMSRIPTVHEMSLDLTLIEELSQFGAPFRFPSQWVVQVQTHYLGGARHFRRWEIVDLGLLVLFRRGGRLVRTKVGLLQSKRLYPDEQQFEEDMPLDYHIGFGRLLETDEFFMASMERREFGFSDSSRYKALEVGNEQYDNIAEYEASGIPVHYLLYHPLQVPWSAVIPIERLAELSKMPCDVACRIVAASSVREWMKAMKCKKGYHPSYADMKDLAAAELGHREAGRRLEEFVVERLLDCKEGYIAEGGPQDEGLERMFFGRTAAISAAVSVTIDAPA